MITDVAAPTETPTDSTTDLRPAPTRRQVLVLRAFTTVAVLEALTWVALLTSMWFKYLAADPTPVGVQVAGPVHGGAFVAYLVMTAVAWRTLRWSPATVVAAVVASVPPLFTVLFEVWAARTGRLVPVRPRA